MPLVTRLLFVFVLVCAAVMSSITRSHYAQASPIRVLSADVVKSSLYSPYRQYLPPSSGRQSSQLQNTNNVFHSRQRGRDYKPFQPEMTGPTNRLFVRQGENLNQYPVVVLKSAPGHPLYQSSRNPEEDPRFEEVSRGDAPKTPARRDQSGGKSVWQTSSVLSSQPGQYFTESRKDADKPTKVFVPRMSNGIRPGGFPQRRVTTLVKKNQDASVFKHSPQPEKVTSSLANDQKLQSFRFKPSFVRREDFGKPFNSPKVSKIEKVERVPKYSRTLSAKEEDHVAQNAGRYQATSRVYLPRHFADQSHNEKLSANVLASGLVAMTTRKPVASTSSERISKLLGVKRSHWPAPMAFASDLPTKKAKSYMFKMANVYPSLSSKYSFGRRKVAPRTTAAPPTTGFQHLKILDRKLLKQPSNQIEAANTAARPSNKSAAQQNFEGLDRNIFQFAYTSPIPETPLQPRNEVLTPGNEQNQTQSERQTTTEAIADGDVSNGTGQRVVEGRSRLFGTSTSSTVQGRRVHAAHRPGPKRVAWNSPIVRLPKRPQGQLMGNTTTTTTADFPNVTKLGVKFSRTEVPLPTSENTSRETTLDIDKENEKNIKTDDESSRSEVFDIGTSETLQEDLLELNYLRISTVNVSFKSL